MMRAATFLCILLLSSSYSFASEPENPKAPALGQGSVSVPINTPFAVQGDHDGANTDHYRIYIDGAQVGADLPVTAKVGTVVTFPNLVIQTCSSHTVQMGAVGPGGETKSAVLTFLGTNCPVLAPAPPTGLRIVVAGSGS